MSPSAAELHQMASIGRLLAGIVHEINTPLGSIFSNNEVLNRSLDKLRPLIAGGGAEDLAKAGAIVDSMQQLVAIDQIACERIRSIIRGLKTIARVDCAEAAPYRSESALARYPEAHSGRVPQAHLPSRPISASCPRWNASHRCSARFF